MGIVVEKLKQNTVSGLIPVNRVCMQLSMSLDKILPRESEKLAKKLFFAKTFKERVRVFDTIYGGTHVLGTHYRRIAIDTKASFNHTCYAFVTG